MGKVSIRFLPGWVIGLLAGVTHAQPVELADYGQTEAVLFGERFAGANALPAVSTAPQVRRQLTAQRFPVVSHRLRPGRPGQKRSQTVAGFTGARPLFLIGADLVSTAWLRANAARLQQQGAQGLVVNVPNARALAQLQRLAGDIPLSAAPADDLAALLNLTHYPVLIEGAR